MKKITFLIIAVITISAANGQGILGKLNKAINKDSGSSVLSSIGRNAGSLGKGLSSDEIINGLKEALSVGAENTSKNLGVADGFFKNAAIKILMPAEADKAAKTLRQFGMGNLVDKAILSMNRAAEDAATGISSIFISSIKQMTVTDGLKILQAGDFAATDYLKKTTTAQLTEKMRPVIEASLAKVNATTYWKDVFTAYNKVSFSKQPVNTDLSSYVTEKAMTGIFYSIGQEEQKIRKDPAAQVTDLLKKVFSK
ncbi:MAG: DUF4197 domain-containing protein [Ferruginibacter sp.]